MTYISDNVNIPRLLLEQAVSYVSEWSEFDISHNSIKYLQSIPTKKLTSPKDNEKDEEIQERAIAEEDHDVPIETLDIYDYDETQIDELNNQLIRALLQLKIIARNFSAFISIPNSTVLATNSSVVSAFAGTYTKQRNKWGTSSKMAWL